MVPLASPRACGTLAGRAYTLSGSGSRSDYAAALLASLGGAVRRAGSDVDPHPALEWAASGAMALTGLADGPPLLAPGALASAAGATMGVLALLAGQRWPRDLDGSALLGERAALLGFTRRGTQSPGGSCRLLPARDGWIALNLARPDDVSLLPAWLEEPGPPGEPWDFVSRAVAERPAGVLLERAHLLGLPAAVAAPPPSEAPPWVRVSAAGRPVRRSGRRGPLVVDLSSLWAGPLCTQLLGLAGARVIKVESTGRPDGARFGSRRFFDLLNAGKASVAVDFAGQPGRDALRRLVEHADIVVESARPRALRQLGIDAESLVQERPGLTWVSITGYGRDEPQAGWVAFGDDAAVAAGLTAATGPAGGPPLFCGDAIADPLSGMHAAVAALASWSAGGGHCLDVALSGVVAHVLSTAPTTGAAVERRSDGGWGVVAGRERAPVAAPRARGSRGRARPLGADTHAVLGRRIPSC